MKPSLVFALLSLAVALEAQELAQFEKILLPVLTTSEIAGANGARFSASMSAFAPVRAQYFPRYEGQPDNTSQATFGTLSGLEPRSFFQEGPPSKSGRLFYIERERASEVFLTPTIVSRTGSDQGTNLTALPIVRERDFRASSVHIHGVGSRYLYEGGPCRSAIPQFRHHLRIYNVDALENAQVIVRMFDEAFFPQPLLREITLAVTSREGADPSYPMVADIVLDEVCHPFSCHTPCAGGSQRVEVTPLTPGLRFWAMVTATDNLTQQVSVMYPQ